MYKYDKIMHIINKLHQAINSYISSNNTFDSILKDNYINDYINELKKNEILKKSDLVSNYEIFVFMIFCVNTKPEEISLEKLTEYSKEIPALKYTISQEVRKINAQTSEKIEIHELNLDNLKLY
mgnify:CR=1 FL=1